MKTNSFRTWWNRDGFGYIKEYGYTEYGRSEAKLGFSFHRHSVFSKTPVTDRETKQQWLDGLKENGYRIYESDNGNDRELIDCPENRKLLMELIKECFPSALVEGFKTSVIYESMDPLFKIDHVKIHISELSELKRLETEYANEKREEA